MPPGPERRGECIHELDPASCAEHWADPGGSPFFALPET